MTWRRRWPRVLALAALVLAAYPAAASAQQTILLARHAERENGEGDDGLSGTGRQRAERLAALVRDAGVTHIFVSDMRRTLETAAPLARDRRLTPEKVGAPPTPRRLDPAERQVRATLSAVSKLPRSAVVLIVGHSNTIPLFLRRLGHPSAVPVGDAEFDNLFVVTPRPTRPPVVVRLRY